MVPHVHVMFMSCPWCRVLARVETCPWCRVLARVEVWRVRTHFDSRDTPLDTRVCLFLSLFFGLVPLTCVAPSRGRAAPAGGATDISISEISRGRARHAADASRSRPLLFSV